MTADKHILQNGSPFRSVGIRVRELSIQINGVPLVENFSHTFAAGRWTCILGPSGVGKSMLLRAVLDLLGNQNNSGVIYKGSVTATDGGSLSGQISYMAQQDLLFPWLNVRENIELGPRLRGKTDSAEPDTNTLLESVDLLDAADQLPSRLSGGMRQRAALARTLKENRPIVVMDEPFSAVDAITRSRLQDLASVFLQGRTVVMVTHDPLEALRLGHEVQVLSGRPAQFSDPIVPTGDVPRPVDSPDVLSEQGRLLADLKAGRE